MPYLTTIIARLLALLDYYLGQFVDVQVLYTSTSCGTALQINATVNACGQNAIGIFGGWTSFTEGIVDLLPIGSALMWAGPFTSLVPYVPPYVPPVP
jgi:hypothetical protein